MQRQNDRETARLWQRPQIALYGPLRAISPAEPALPAVIRPFLRGCAAHHAIEAISVITRRAATERFAPRFRALGNFQIGPQQQRQVGFPAADLDQPGPVANRLGIDSLDPGLLAPEEPFASLCELAAAQRDKAREAPRGFRTTAVPQGQQPDPLA